MKKITNQIVLMIFSAVGLLLSLLAGIVYVYSRYSDSASDSAGFNAYASLFLGMTILLATILLLFARKKNIYLKLTALLIILVLFFCQLYFSFLISYSVCGLEFTGCNGLLTFFPVLSIVFLLLDILLIGDFFPKNSKIGVVDSVYLFVAFVLPFFIITFQSNKFDDFIMDIQNSFGISVQNIGVGIIDLPFKARPISLTPFGGGNQEVLPNTYTYAGMRFYWDQPTDIFSSSDGTVKEILQSDTDENHSIYIQHSNSAILYGRLITLDSSITISAKIKKGQLLGQARVLYWTYANKVSGVLNPSSDFYSCPANLLSSESKAVLSAIPFEKRHGEFYSNGSLCGR